MPNVCASNVVWTSSKVLGVLDVVQQVAGLEAILPGAGMDIASEVAQSRAVRTLLSCRRPVHVVPRYIFGKPADAQLKPWYNTRSSLALPCLNPPAAACQPLKELCYRQQLECMVV